jgi:sugar/nucleoside kinase (ribokinase family)
MVTATASVLVVQKRESHTQQPKTGCIHPSDINDHFDDTVTVASSSTGSTTGSLPQPHHHQHQQVIHEKEAESSTVSVCPTADDPATVQFHIIGDVYVDLLCYLPPSATTSAASFSSSSSSSPPPSSLSLHGGDTTMSQPVTIMAGGSTLNTATYLQFALEHMPMDEHMDVLHVGTPHSSPSPPTLTCRNSRNQYNITVHSVFNPNDHYGTILMQHANQYSITLRNALPVSQQGLNQSHTGTPITPRQPPCTLTTGTGSTSTPHCVVLVSSSTRRKTNIQNSSDTNTTPSSATTSTATERTFLTHRGCASNMTIDDLFPVQVLSSNDTDEQEEDRGSSPRIQNPLPCGNVVLSPTNTHTATPPQPLHLHIAGFYCTHGFWNTATTTTTPSKKIGLLPRPHLSSSSSSSPHSLVAFLQRLLEYRQSITVPQQHPTTIVSLVTQYDATQTWDITVLRAMLPLVHICIMNEQEALQIYLKNKNDDRDNDGEYDPNHAHLSDDDDDDDDHVRMISFFTPMNPSTIFVVTKGVKGAIAFRNGRIVARVNHTVDISTMVTTLTTTTTNTITDHITIDPTGAGDAFCAGFFHAMWQSMPHNNHHHRPTTTTTTNTIPTYFTPTEYYWPATTSNHHETYDTNNMIQQALIVGCTLGTCCVSQRGGSAPPDQDQARPLVRNIYQQYILQNNTTNNNNK